MKNIYLILLIAGIILRFILQFVFPAFNVDEISLGNNIKYSSFIELLYPLKHNQSSPPFYLWLQKLIVQISPFSFWINIKLLSFISSVLGVILFYLFIRKNDYKLIFLLTFIIFLFNPFIINNSLTVKQYTFDLTGIVFMIVYFKSRWFNRYSWIFFMVWCLMSNIGLFACAGYLIYDFNDQKTINKSKNIFDYFKKNIRLFFAPLPYIIYFIWFMKQNGAAELKEYMVNYWSSSFIPLNENIFKYLIYTIHGLWIFIFNAFEVWGMFLMILMVSFFIFFRRRNVLFKQEIELLFYVLLVHLILNIFHLYPFSDRLYLYLSALFLLVLASSTSSILNLNILKKYFLTLNLLISVITLFLYSLYITHNDNDIIGLYNKLKHLKGTTIYLTEKSMDCVLSFNDFTDNEFTSEKVFSLIDKKLDNSKYIVSRVSKKIKMNSTSPEEMIVQNLILKNRIRKIDSVNGYNIYEIVK
jgi:hypothetical protein